MCTHNKEGLVLKNRPICVCPMRVVEIRYRWKPGVATQFTKFQGKLREQLPQLVVKCDELCGKPRFSLFISPRRPFRNIYESGAVYAMVPVRETALECATTLMSRPTQGVELVLQYQTRTNGKTTCRVRTCHAMLAALRLDEVTKPPFCRLSNTQASIKWV